MTDKTKTVVNYSPELTATIVADYKAGVSVEAIAAAIGKTTRSVIAKLSREKVYTAKVRTTKTGGAIVKKDATADAIGVLLGLSEPEIESLTKANKTVLLKVLAVLSTNSEEYTPDA